MAALHTLGVPEDSPLRNPGRIPFPDSSLAMQNPRRPIDEKETDSLRELLEQIDAHVELIGTEATSDLPLTTCPVKMLSSNLPHSIINRSR